MFLKKNQSLLLKVRQKQYTSFVEEMTERTKMLFHGSQK